MVSVVIAALSGTASLGTAGLMDALNKADLAQALHTGQPARRVFDVHLVGLDNGSVSCRDGVSLHPAIIAADVTAPDLVVVPGLDDDLATSFDDNRRWVPWLRTWHAAGSRIASCTGAFLIADAGLLDGRPATTHWMFAGELQRRYPAVDVTADRMIVDTGDVITSGGATAFLNLVLYLAERFAGHDHANLAAKVLLVDGHRPSQRPYIAFGRERSHGDTIVHQVQQHVDLHLGDPLRITELRVPVRPQRADPVPAVSRPPPAAGRRPTSSTPVSSTRCAFSKRQATRSTRSAVVSAITTRRPSAVSSRTPPACHPAATATHTDSATASQPTQRGAFPVPAQPTTGSTERFQAPLSIPTVEQPATGILTHWRGPAAVAEVDVGGPPSSIADSAPPTIVPRQSSCAQIILFERSPSRDADSRARPPKLPI